MQTIQIQTDVLPGSRIEIASPELPVGARVDVTITLPEKPAPRRLGIFEFLESLPPSTKTEEEWAREDAEFLERRRESDR